MIKFRLRPDGQIYRTIFWMEPNVRRSRKGITLKEVGLGPVKYIEGIRNGEMIFELRISPGLPREGTEFSYDRKTGYLTVTYDGKPILSYEFPAGYANIPEEFRVLEN